MEVYEVPSQEVLDLHYGYVYKITNVKNGKIYYGQHKHKIGEPWLRYLGSGAAKRFQSLDKAFKKKELVAFAEDKQELNRLELMTILKAKMANESLYNRSSGGIVGTYTAIKKYFKCSDEEVLELLEKNEHNWDQMAMIYRAEKEKKRAARRAKQASVKIDKSLLYASTDD